MKGSGLVRERKERPNTRFHGRVAGDRPCSAPGCAEPGEFRAPPPEGVIEASLLIEPAEKALAAALDKVTPVVDEKFRAHEYAQALSALADLRDAVDAFFNDVMVMADDETLRNNRLALLSHLHLKMNLVADLSKLAA